MPEDPIHLEYLCLLKTHIASFSDILVDLHDLLPPFIEVKERIRSASLQPRPFVLLRLLFVAQLGQILDFTVFR